MSAKPRKKPVPKKQQFIDVVNRELAAVQAPSHQEDATMYFRFVDYPVAPPSWWRRLLRRFW